jgi:hypothetical protein
LPADESVIGFGRTDGSVVAPEWLLEVTFMRPDRLDSSEDPDVLQGP